MEKIRFNDKAFRDHIGTWVQTVDDEDLSRAWDIVVGCLAVHCKLDRQPGQSAAQAKREAYQDFALAFEGGDATYTMVGLLYELEQMCPAEVRAAGEFQRVVEEAIRKGRGEERSPDSPRQRVIAGRKQPPEPDPDEPGEDSSHLTLLEGGKT